MTDTVSTESWMFSTPRSARRILDARNSDDAAKRAGRLKRRQPSQWFFGPEILRYDLVRSVLCDARFRTPPGLGLELQGITSGPLWERVGETILGRTVSTITGCASLSRRCSHARRRAPACRHRRRHLGLLDQVTPAGSCDVVAQIARPYPVPVICAALGAPREDWQLISHWADELTNMTRNAPTSRRCCGNWATGIPTSTTWWRPDVATSPTICCPI